MKYQRQFGTNDNRTTEQQARWTEQLDKDRVKRQGQLGTTGNRTTEQQARWTEKLDYQRVNRQGQVGTNGNRTTEQQARWTEQQDRDRVYKRVYRQDRYGTNGNRTTEQRQKLNEIAAKRAASRSDKQAKKKATKKQQTITMAEKAFKEYTSLIAEDKLYQLTGGTIQKLLDYIVPLEPLNDKDKPGIYKNASATDKKKRFELCREKDLRKYFTDDCKSEFLGML